MHLELRFLISGNDREYSTTASAAISVRLQSMLRSSTSLTTGLGPTAMTLCPWASSQNRSASCMMRATLRGYSLSSQPSRCTALMRSAPG